MALPDNRVRFPAAKIDFASDVGVASQDHDDQPSPGPARYDWMRMYLIGLLSQQSSFDEPTQYRDGTPWFDLNTFTLKIRSNGAWVPLSDAIAVAEDDEGVTTLTEWFSSVSDTLASSAPEVVFNGSSSADGITTITIPESLRAYLYSDSRPFVYINGILTDPRNSRLDPSANPTSVKLSNVSLSENDTFTIVIHRIPSATFYSSSVSVP